jgi:hypothetical protein
LHFYCLNRRYCFGLSSSLRTVIAIWVARKRVNHTYRDILKANNRYTTIIDRLRSCPDCFRYWRAASHCRSRQEVQLFYQILFCRPLKCRTDLMGILAIGISRFGITFITLTIFKNPIKEALLERKNSIRHLSFLYRLCT